MRLLLPMYIGIIWEYGGSFEATMENCRTMIIVVIFDGIRLPKNVWVCLQRENTPMMRRWTCRFGRASYVQKNPSESLQLPYDFCSAQMSPKTPGHFISV